MLCPTICQSSISGYDSINLFNSIENSSATYTGAFGPIRDWFTSLPESKSRGYKPGRFSFNVKGGRCGACEGDGVITYEMHFLPDVYIECDECKGSRYNRETLEVKSMKKGDQCFFYHSNIGKEIVGIVEVIKEAYIDKTDKNRKFVAVTVKFVEKFSKPITLESIKKSKELAHLALIKQSRLSVMPIDSKSWKILNKMSKI